MLVKAQRPLTILGITIPFLWISFDLMVADDLRIGPLAPGGSET